jgi:serine/threonine protein kinase
MFRSSDYAKIEREYKIQAKLDHPHIARLEHFELSEENQQNKRRLTIYIEYCENGNLDDYVRDSFEKQTRIPPDFIWRFIEQLGSALSYCHNRSPPEDVVLHRDLKPNNSKLLLKSTLFPSFLLTPVVFLVARENAQVDIKIGDFGSAVEGASKTQFSGDYVAPVRIPRLPQERDLTLEGDKTWAGEKTMERQVRYLLCWM